jgi:hypothetical protein
MKSSKKSEGPEIRFLDDVFGIVWISSQPTGQVVGRVQVWQ